MATFALHLTLSPDRIATVSAELMTAGAGAVEERASPGAAELIVYSAERSSLLALELEVEPLLNADPNYKSRIEELDDSWQTAWADDLPAVAVAQGWWVEPTTSPGTAPKGARVLRIAPALAFGVGSHETTRLCAQALVDHLGEQPDLSPRILDVGCGSGVLSLLAAALGAPDVQGIDIDPTSVAASQKNRDLNVGWAPQLSHVRFSETPLAHLDQPHDLVLANLERPVQLELARDLARLTRGRLILSGVLEGAEEEVLATHLELGARLVSRSVLGEWVCLQLNW